MDCSVSNDTTFAAAQGNVAYYMRVFEVDSYTWRHYDCATSSNGPDDCGNEAEYPKTARQRAWSSPIFYDDP